MEPKIYVLRRSESRFIVGKLLFLIVITRESILLFFLSVLNDPLVLCCLDVGHPVLDHLSGVFIVTFHIWVVSKYRNSESFSQLLSYVALVNVFICGHLSLVCNLFEQRIIGLFKSIRRNLLGDEIWRNLIWEQVLLRREAMRVVIYEFWGIHSAGRQYSSFFICHVGQNSISIMLGLVLLSIRKVAPDFAYWAHVLGVKHDRWIYIYVRGVRQRSLIWLNAREVISFHNCLCLLDDGRRNLSILWSRWILRMFNYL